MLLRVFTTPTLTVQLVVGDGRVRQRIPVRRETVRVFGLDGPRPQGGVRHQSVVDDDVLLHVIPLDVAGGVQTKHLVYGLQENGGELDNQQYITDQGLGNRQCAAKSQRSPHSPRL